MDELEKRLKRDAESIEAAVPAELAARVRTALRSATPARRRARDTVPLGMWLAASLSGAAAAVLVILLLPGPDTAPPSPAPAAHSPRLPAGIAREFPLSVKTAELTAPLEEELANLQSDIEKARKRVQQDLDF